MAFVAGVLGLLLGVALAFLLEYLERSREQQPLVYQRVAQAWRRSGRRRRDADPDPDLDERSKHPIRQPAER
jgi:hypothetical protein